VHVAEQVGADDVVDAVIAASLALVAVAARSLSAVADEVTLAQFRALLVLASRGPARVVDLAEDLEVNSSTATRMCDRLLAKGLISREREHDNPDRRTVRVSITLHGRALIAAVMRKRRAEVRTIMRRLPPEARATVVAGLREFAEAAGEAPHQTWSLGWS